MLRATALLALALLGLVACGDDAEEDEKAIRDVIVQSLTTREPEEDCNSRLSSGLIDKTYGSRARCVSVEKANDDEPAESVTFSRVEVDGDAGTAAIRIRGGESGGASGEMEVVREDGDWRIDELSVPLLRSLVSAGFAAGGGGLPAGVRGCLQRELSRLPGPQLRRTAYAMIGETEAGERRIFELLARCRGAGGRSSLQALFERGIVGSLRQRGASDAQIRCVVNRLRADVTDEELAGALAGDGARQRAARLIRPAIESCN